MNTQPITVDHLRSSVIAVPPLCRLASGKISAEHNRNVIRHIEDGGVTLFLYGGNANFYHIRPSEYSETLGMLADCASAETSIIPSVGPAYGMMMDQAAILQQYDFPTVMVLPTTSIMTEPGLMNGFRDFVQAFGKPAVLYIKEEGYITAQGAAQLVESGDVSFIKYAIVRDQPGDDEFLSELIQQTDPDRIVSGIGEQPAMIHMTKFRCSGFTSGCVCVNPMLSMKMLAAVHDGRFDDAEAIRKIFLPLEDLRNEVNPIRVLHEAVELAGIATTGPLQPLLHGLPESIADKVRSAAQDLKTAS